MRFERKVKCKMCSKKSAEDWVYKFWHFVVCYEYIDPLDITLVKSWWVCNACKPEPQHSWRDRFHDIDGFTYFLTWKFPFIRRG